MPLENFVHKPFVVIMPNVPVNFAHHFAEVLLVDSLVLVQVRVEGPHDVVFEICADDRGLFEGVENRGDEVSDDVDVDCFGLSVLKCEDSEYLFRLGIRYFFVA